MKQQQGVALLIVLMIVALVAILATEMGARLQLHIQRIANVKDSNQAFWYAMGAEAFASKSLRDLVEQADGVISLDQAWSQEFTFPLDNGGIKARLEDMQSCFNLNALYSQPNNNSGQPVTESMEAFARMLPLVDENIDSFTAETVRDSLADWLDEDDRMRPLGAEDSTYEALAAPYLAANQLMSLQSELRLINGVDPRWLAKLLPLVCVIPDVTELKINVNTLTPERAPLLAGLTGMSLGEASNLIATRPASGWRQREDFLAESVVQGLALSNVQQEWFTVTTNYFMLHAQARYNNAVFSISSLLQVAEDGGSLVLRREFGGTE